MENKKALLVEDDASIIDIYTELFKTSGLCLQIAANGGDAIKALKEGVAGKQQKPDIVLLDLILPDMNGMEVIRFIRSSKETSAIPVFVLSNDTITDTGSDSRIKPDRFIVKAETSASNLVKIVTEQLSKK